jgi:hypothetical protein
MSSANLAYAIVLTEFWQRLGDHPLDQTARPSVAISRLPWTCGRTSRDHPKTAERVPIAIVAEALISEEHERVIVCLQEFHALGDSRCRAANDLIELQNQKSFEREITKKAADLAKIVTPQREICALSHRLTQAALFAASPHLAPTGRETSVSTIV